MAPSEASTRRRNQVPLDDESDEIPQEIIDSIIGLGLLAGGANVIMQLARLPVGHGVAESRVASGRVDRHPLKRLRTTTAYLVIAMLGTTDERLQLRREIDRVHAQVRSRPDDPVAYDAFDPELQLWVAACLYKGFEDIIEWTTGAPPDRDLVDDVLYPHGRRFATTLQVPHDAWPADRDAFEDYWQAGVAGIEMDDLTRAYLRDIARMAFVVAPLGPLGTPLRPLLAPIGQFLNVGFLPQPFRDELGLDLPPAADRAHRTLFRTLGAVAHRMPAAVRMYPLNRYLTGTRRRFRAGTPVI